MRPAGARTWVEISKEALRHNIETIRTRIGDAALGAVVKSNAYGHGMELVAGAVKDTVDWFCVDELAEGVQLREAGHTLPILVLGYTLPELYEEAKKYDLSVTISSFDSLEKADGVKIHLKIDTGMHRQGFLPEDVSEVLKRNIQIEGLYTHFASLDSHTHDAFSEAQLAVFQKVVAQVREAGYAPLVHASASSGILSDASFHFDMVRMGIALYGLWPSQDMEEQLKDKVELRPVLTWKSLITEIKEIGVGEKVGYGCTFEATRETKMAVIPVGYFHGLPRSISNKGYMVVRGKKAPIIGNVSMAMSVVDVTDIPEGFVGEEVVLVGKDIPAMDIGALEGTIDYEVVTRINPGIERVAV